MTVNARATALDTRTPTFGSSQPDADAPTPRRDRISAGAAGALMLGAFLAYGVGSSIALANAPGTSSTTSFALLFAGVGSMLLNSGVVVAIAALLFPILKRHSPQVALLYLGTRIFEGVALGVGAVALLTLTGPAAITTNFVAYNVAMAGLGIGSLAFCVVLFRSGLAPRFLAAWGFVGYAAFAAGCLLELAGVTGAGLVAAIPGGGFEIVFAIWLIARGLRPAAASAATRSARA